MQPSEWQVRMDQRAHAKVTVEFADGRKIEVPKAAVTITMDTPQYHLRDDRNMIVSYGVEEPETTIEVKPIGGFRLSSTTHKNEPARELTLEEFYAKHY